MLTGLPAVTTNLVENGHPGYVVVTSRAGIAVGSTVDLHSSATNHLGLKVKSLVGNKVYLWDPAAQTNFNASAFLLADGANLQQAAQDVFGGILRDAILDPEEDGLPLSTAELAAILTSVLPGGAGAASNVTVLNFPPQQHVIVDNQVTFQLGATQNTGNITAHPQNVALPLLGSAGAAITIAGTWSGTLVFEASFDAGATWRAIDSINPDATSEKAASTTTVNGTFQPLRLQGATHVRVRTSAWTSGTASIYASGSNAVSDAGDPSLAEPGVTIPSYGSMVGGSDGTNFRPLKVVADGSVVLDQTGFTDGSHKTQVTNFPATQPISAVALPLPAGAATSAAQTNGSQATQVVQGGNTLTVDASGRITVNINGTVPVSGNVGILGTVPVSGTFWQATQPISAVSLPLPAGAATDASLTNGLQVTQLAGWSRVDTNNSTSAPLGANATWNFAAPFTDMLGWSALQGNVFVDQPGTMFIDESPDGVNFTTSTIPVLGSNLNTLITMGHTIDSRYYRFRWQNGATPQAVFRFQLLNTKDGVSGDQVAIGAPIYPGQKGQLVKSVISGMQPASEAGAPSGYKEVEVDSHGAMMVTQSGMHGAFGGSLNVNELAVATFKANFGINTRTASQSAANGGSVSWANSQAILQTGAASNGFAKLGTREAVRYVPGQGIIARMAPMFSTPAGTSRQAVGLLNDSNGFGFGYNGTTFGVVIRNNSVDTWVPQASWNGDDKFDGTGPTGVTLNPQTGCPMAIQMQWLGFGAVRWFIEDPNSGDMVLCHILKFANSSTTPSIRQPDLPVRFEVVNVGNTSNLTAKVSSMGGYHEGDSSVPGADVRFAFTNAKSGLGTGGTELWALRNKDTNIYGGANINTINVHIDKISLRNSSTGDAFVQLYLNPTLTTPTFADRRTATSVCETDTVGTWSPTFPASGELVANFCLAGGSTTDVLLAELAIRLVPGDVLAVVAFAETTNVSVRCGMSWHEET